MPKITALPAATAAAPDDVVPGNDDSASSTKKFSLTVIKEWLQSLTSWISAAMIAGIDKSLLTTDSNPYKFSVYRHASWTTGTPSKVPFDTEEFDTNNNFDSTTNYRYVAPVSGYYQFNAAVGFGPGDGVGHITYLFKNGVFYRQGNAAISYAGPFNRSSVLPCFMQLAAGDYVEVYFYSNGDAGHVDGNTWFNGYLVSKS